MLRTLRLVLFVLFPLAWAFPSAAQLISAPTPLELDGQPRQVQLPAYANFGNPQCDSEGTVYLRRETDDDNSWEIAKISTDGSAQRTLLADVPGFTDRHTFTLAVDGHGAVHEVVRAWKENQRSMPLIYYLRFQPDGSFRSNQAFEKEFIPGQLVPLPDGNFFAAGVIVKKTAGSEDIEQTPLTGLFDYNTRFLSKLGTAKSARLMRTSTPPPDNGDNSDDNALQENDTVRLGDDGNLYALFTEGGARVRVYRQTGAFLRDMKLRQPFEEGLATGLWVSGGRILVTYEGEAEKPKDAVTYIVYDSGTGDLIRAYRPQYTGVVACFQDGQSATVLQEDKLSGMLSIGTAALR